MADLNRNSNVQTVRITGTRRLSERKEVEKPKEGMKTLKRLVQYFYGDLPMLIILMLAVLLTVTCSVYAPKLQSNAIDAIAAAEFERIGGILIKMLVLYGVLSVCAFLQSRFSALLSQSVVKKMREDLFDCIVNLPIRYLDSHSHGDIMSRMTNDVENISNTVSQSLSSLFSGGLTVIGTMGMMLYLCPKLALLSCIIVVLTVLVTKYLSAVMKKFYRRRQALLGNLNGTVEEMVSGYKTVVAYNRQTAIMEEFNQTADSLTKTGIIAEIFGSSMGPMMNLINNIGFVIIAAFGGYFAIKGEISIGVISAFIVYAKQFGRPIDELAQVYGQIQTAIAGAERVFSIMDEPKEDKSGSKQMENMKGKIVFKDVNFSYVPGKTILHNFNLEIHAGQKIALVGSTGSGKTTVVNLLMRFYDVDSGQITIDGVNIKDIDCNALRKNTAIVLQDTVLFANSVRENLKYSNQNASDEEMIQSTQLGNCHGMIMKLKDGYDTKLEKSGQNLSEGQRQLLSIARAFLSQPKILILDEATSSVDTRTEKNIQNAMVKLMENRTSLIIAHRLSTIQDADCIVVMDKGEIVESGNHRQLIEKRGKYYELYMTQFAGNTT